MAKSRSQEVERATELFRMYGGSTGRVPVKIQQRLYERIRKLAKAT